MAFDVVVFGDDYRFLKELHIDGTIHGILFRKLVTPEEYPSLSKAKDEAEDIVFQPEDVHALLDDVLKLENYLEGESLMSPEVKKRCMAFAERLKDICQTAESLNRSVDFIAGE